MRRTRTQGWWDELRFGGGWQVILALVLAATIVATMFIAPIFRRDGHILSHAEIADQQRQKEAACIARGGHIVEMIAPGRGVENRTCYGGKWPWQQ